MDVHGQLQRAQLENFSTAGRPAFGILGRMIFDTNLLSPMIDIGTSWVEVPNVDNVTIEKIANQVIRLKDGGITNDKLAIDSVYGNKLKDAGISTGKYVDGSITFDKLAVDSVYGNRIKDAGIITGKYVDGSVSHVKFADMAPATNTFNSVVIDSNSYALALSLNLTVTNTNRPHHVSLEPLGTDANPSEFYYQSNGLCYFSLRVDGVEVKNVRIDPMRFTDLDFGLLTGLAVGVRTIEVFVKHTGTVGVDELNLKYGRLVAYPV